MPTELPSHRKFHPDDHASGPVGMQRAAHVARVWHNRTIWVFPSLAPVRPFPAAPKRNQSAYSTATAPNLTYTTRYRRSAGQYSTKIPWRSPCWPLPRVRHKTRQAAVFPSLPQSTFRFASADDQGPLNPVAHLGGPRTSPWRLARHRRQDLSRLAFVSENPQSVSRETRLEHGTDRAGAFLCALQQSLSRPQPGSRCRQL